MTQSKVSQLTLLNITGPTRPLKRHDRVVWIDPDGNPEHGIVKWLGTIDGEPCAGLKLVSIAKGIVFHISFQNLSSNRVGWLCLCLCFYYS